MSETIKQNIQTQNENLTAERKALLINLSPKIFGTFAEIGAGQEVARYFFRVGGAANTVAKTMSAYDMTFSDEIYGKATRYVSRERLEAMLHHEYNLLVERLSVKRGSDSTFFVFADTVSARGYKGTSECHGWMGVRFQTEPLSTPSTILMHVRMTDKENLLQQEALGIVGVNLLYSSFFLRDNIDQFLNGLLEGLSTQRIEVDMLEFSGPAFTQVDNRLVSLKLVRKNLTNAIVLPPDGRVLQASEVLYGKALIVERGRYQPVTHVHVDMLEQAKKYFKNKNSNHKDYLVLCEISLQSLNTKEQLQDEQLLGHSDMLTALGYTVLISNNPEFHRLVSYFRRYTKERILVVAGVDVIVKLFNEKYYNDLDGGMLEGIGRLFQSQVTLLLYPMRKDRFLSILGRTEVVLNSTSYDTAPNLLQATDIQVTQQQQLLLTYLLQTGAIDNIDCSDARFLEIDSNMVLKQFYAQDPEWENSVPTAAVKVIKSKQVAL